jgi:hypothetical protein
MVLHCRLDYLEADTSQIAGICQARNAVENPLDNLNLSTIDLTAVRAAAELLDFILQREIGWMPVSLKDGNF